jgi:hypothetical protein
MSAFPAGHCDSPLVGFVGDGRPPPGLTVNGLAKSRLSGGFCTSAVSNDGELRSEAGEGFCDVDTECGSDTFILRISKWQQRGNSIAAKLEPSMQGGDGKTFPKQSVPLSRPS